MHSWLWVAPTLLTWALLSLLRAAFLCLPSITADGEPSSQQPQLNAFAQERSTGSGI